MPRFNFYGLIFMIAVMIPNIIFAYTHKGGFENKIKCRAVVILEEIGRYGCFGFMLLDIPYLWQGYWFEAGHTLYLVFGVILVLLYIVGWIVFWRANSLAKAVILSVLPSLLFIMCGVLPLNIPLIVFAVIFAPCHIVISVKNAVG